MNFHYATMYDNYVALRHRLSSMIPLSSVTLPAYTREGIPYVGPVFQSTGFRKYDAVVGRNWPPGQQCPILTHDCCLPDEKRSKDTHREERAKIGRDVARADKPRWWGNCLITVKSASRDAIGPVISPAPPGGHPDSLAKRINWTPRGTHVARATIVPLFLPPPASVIHYARAGTCHAASFPDYNSRPALFLYPSHRSCAATQKARGISKGLMHPHAAFHGLRFPPTVARREDEAADLIALLITFLQPIV